MSERSEQEQGVTAAEAGVVESAPEAPSETSTEPETYPEPETHPEPVRSRRESLLSMGEAAMPYWFAITGIGLGIGSVLLGQPLAGACGAVAGVTAGLLQQSRATQYRGQLEVVRNRLRTQRAASEETALELRRTVSTLRNEVWELQISQRVAIEMARRESERRLELEAVVDGVVEEDLALGHGAEDEIDGDEDRELTATAEVAEDQLVIDLDAGTADVEDAEEVEAKVSAA